MLAVAVATAVFGSSWEGEGRRADKQMTTWVNLGNPQILCAGNEEEHIVKLSDSTDRESSIHQTFEEKLWSVNQFFSKLWLKKEKSVRLIVDNFINSNQNVVYLYNFVYNEMYGLREWRWKTALNLVNFICSPRLLIIQVLVSVINLFCQV